ncbi:MAG: sigma-70 family RNA polymerase sigma factor [Chloroflexi bacterium]|nr:MAG: sigma-70 family RNA polymerase sigma factor [Chloroflexota bacterium]
MTHVRTNEQWVSELSQNDPVALADLRTHIRRSILYYLSRERSDLRDRSGQELEQMADDMAQDATLRVMENLANFRGESKFTTWVNRIAVRIAISELRRARYKNFSLDNITADGDLIPDSAKLNLNQRPPQPEDAVERDDVMTTIFQTMKSALTERQYQALVAVALRGVPMDVVAEQMETNRNALYKLLHDARRKLKAHLESQGLSMEYMMRLFER